MNERELKQHFPRASQSFLNANAHSGLRTETNKPNPRKALGSQVAGEKKSDARIVLRYVLYRVRLLDPDAIDGATKVCTDCLQQIGLISGDSSKDIILEATQEKVAHFKDEHTKLTIIYP